jgi:hypothetical protein
MVSGLKHHRSLAGTSITKACVRFCCVTMRPVATSNWNKTTVTGYQA